ncbi:MAG: 4Fe-4S binding protein [Erysipelotrichaceae bacterium]|nr:4Fe-4S binding protein [Erysipelotrichaceae bacterium]
MSMFQHEAKQFKFDVMREVAKRCFEGKLNDNLPDELAHLLIPTNTAYFRCCIYKEREIIRERTKIACLKDPQTGKEVENKKQIVRILEPACDGCTIHKIRITDNCRKCMAKSCMSSCNFNAITMGKERAIINYEKCRECGACARNCQYNAIVVTERPCVQKCPVDAIHWDEAHIAVIDENKCINCGQCEKACPFGAIEDLSWMVPVIEDIKAGKKVIATFAPSIQGQFDEATIPQIKASIKMLGFADAVEVAVGADAVSYYEFEEFVEKQEQGINLTTSCCPAFLNMARIHYPTVYQKNMSTTVSPMVALARYLKMKDPEVKVCFIGPCVAKKQEAQMPGTETDYVLSYQELAAMLVSQHIYPMEVEPDDGPVPTVFGRNFAVGTGVTKSVLQMAKEAGYEKPVKAVYADGCMDCKKNLLLMKVGRLDANLLEGMSCPGGCLNGPVVVEDITVARKRMVAENAKEKPQTIKESLTTFDFSQVDMHRKY